MTGIAASPALEPRRAGVAAAPPVPETVEATGLTREAIVDLLLKTLYAGGATPGRELALRLGLLFTLIDEILLDLQQRQWVEVRGTRGPGRDVFVFDLTTEGRGRAREAMDASRYVGPAPVPFELYAEWVARQSVQQLHVDLAAIEHHLSHLVLSPATIRRLGPAVNSGKSIFLYGHSGNGKTVIAEAIAGMIGGDVYVPHAVEVEGQIVIVQDPVYHRPFEPAARELDSPSWLQAPPAHDPRFARVSRPVVFAGGELTLAELDLRYDPSARYYQAPFQMKANGGVLIIDDLGRQMVEPHALLNRWIVPLEKRVDYLTLHTGHKFPVPFDCLVVFATNLAPADLADEAFLRRIHYKIHVDGPGREQYAAIFRACCEAREVEYQGRAVERVFERFYEGGSVAPRSCHPRDIVDHLCDLARFVGARPELRDDLLDEACATYFLDVEEAP